MLELFSSTMRAQLPITKLLLINLQNSQLEWGQDLPILSFPYPEKSYLSITWLTLLWKIISEHEYTIQIPNIIVPKTTRIRDTYIMKDFTPFFATNELQTLNQFRMFLQVITISDIMEVDGIHFKTSCTTNPSPQRSSLKWPDTPKPPTSAWYLWRRALRWTYHSDTSLLSHLGQWIPQTYHLIYDTMWHFPSNTIYKYNGSYYMKYNPLDNNALVYLPTEHIASPPKNSIPSKTFQSRIGLKRTYPTSHPRIPHNSLPLPSFPSIPSLNTHETEQIKSALINGSLQISCDGSLKDTTSAYAVCIHTSGNEDIISYGEICPMIDSKISSLYPELCGDLAVSKLIKHLVDPTNPSSHAYQVYIDNRETVSRCQCDYKLLPTASYYNISSDLIRTIRATPSLGQWNWIKSHQDLTDLPTVLNNKADNYSNKIRESFASEPSPPLKHLPLQPFMILFQ